MLDGNLGRKSLLLFGSTSLNTMIGMLVSLLVARRLGPAAVGSIGFGLGVAGLVMAALLPGFGQAHLKRVAEGEDPGRCMGTMAVIQLALALPLVLAVLLVAALTGGFASSQLTFVVVCMLAAQLVAAFADTALRVFLGRQWVTPHALVSVGGRAVRLVATLAVLVWHPSVTWVAATYLLEPVVNLAAAAALLAGVYGIRPRAPTRASLRGYWTYARPFVLITPLAMFQDSIDRFLVGRWAGLTAAGYYHVARSLWDALNSVLAPPGLLVFTRLSALYAARSEAARAETRRFFFGALDRMLFITVPLAFAFWAFAELLLRLLYGDGFAPAAKTLRILVLVSIVMAVVNPYTQILYAIDRVDRLVRVNIARALVYLAALAALVPPGPELAVPTGDAGAALARLVLILFPAWVYWRWTQELVGVPFYPRVWTYIGGLALLLATHHAVLSAISGGSLVATVAAAAIALAAYAAWLWWRHPDAPDNARYVGALLSPGAFLDVVRGPVRRREN